MKKINITYIIDDDPIFVFGLKKMLEHANFCNEFSVFNNGEDAIEALKPIIKTGVDFPELILLDLNMPIMDGWQFLDEFIKEKPTKKAIIYIISSSIDPVDIEKAKEYENVSSFVIKPITRDKIKYIAEEIHILVDKKC
ncbi:response regulator [Lacinutrix undariae]